MASSRRDFIKTLGLTGLAAMSMPEVLSASESIESSNETDKKKGLTFLFQGDSITDGNRTRNTDWNHVMGHGYQCLIASRLWYDYPEKELMFYNRGISGNRVRDLDNRWQKDALDLKPDVVSILIGVNDVGSMINSPNPDPIDKYEETYRKILDKTKEALPETMFVLMEPFILPLGHVLDNKEKWETEILKKQQVVKSLAESYHAIFVKLQEPFTNACKKAPAKYWIWDGIHPMPAGHELMSRLWLNEVSKKLTFIKYKYPKI